MSAHLRSSKRTPEQVVGSIHYLIHELDHDRLWQAGWVTAAVGRGAAAYSGLCALLRGEEARIVVAGVRRKLGLR